MPIWTCWILFPLAKAGFGQKRGDALGPFLIFLIEKVMEHSQIVVLFYAKHCDQPLDLWPLNSRHDDEHDDQPDSLDIFGARFPSVFSRLLRGARAPDPHQAPRGGAAPHLHGGGQRCLGGPGGEDAAGDRCSGW